MILYIGYVLFDCEDFTPVCMSTHKNEVKVHLKTEYPFNTTKIKSVTLNSREIIKLGWYD